jgi:hypothetical protein
MNVWISIECMEMIFQVFTLLNVKYITFFFKVLKFRNFQMSRDIQNGSHHSIVQKMC